jgi:TolB protein
MLSIFGSRLGKRSHSRPKNLGEWLAVEIQASAVVSDGALFLWGGLAWLRDGRLLYIASRESLSERDMSLWEIKTDLRTGSPSGKPEKMINWPGASARFPTVSKDGKRLILSKFHAWANVYVGELKENGTRLDSPKRFSSRESEDFPSSWTSDNKAILFSSDRTGRSQIFKQRAGEDDAELLVRSSDDLYGAEISPDGAWILYVSEPHGGNPPPHIGESDETSNFRRIARASS